MLFHTGFHILDIFPQICPTFHKPLFSGGVGRFCRRQPHKPRAVIAGLGHHFPECAPQICIGNPDVGNLQPCQIEGFAGRRTGDGDIRQRRTDGSQAGEGMPRINKILVDLIGHDFHTVGQTDAAQPFQLFSRPHPATGIVGIAEQQQLDLFLRDLPLQLLKIHLVVAIPDVQCMGHQPPPGLFHTAGERAVHRTQDHHRVAGSRQRLHRSKQGKHHTGRAHQPLRPQLTAVMPLIPIRQHGKIFLFTVGIPVNAPLYDLAKCLLYPVRRPEIHIRHPHGQRVLRHVEGLLKVHFDRHGMAPVYHLIKSTVHLISSTFSFILCHCSEPTSKTLVPERLSFSFEKAVHDHQPCPCKNKHIRQVENDVAQFFHGHTEAEIVHHKALTDAVAHVA